MKLILIIILCILPMVVAASNSKGGEDRGISEQYGNIIEKVSSSVARSNNTGIENNGIEEQSKRGDNTIYNTEFDNNRGDHSDTAKTYARKSDDETENKTAKAKYALLAAYEYHFCEDCHTEVVEYCKIAQSADEEYYKDHYDMISQILEEHN